MIIVKFSIASEKQPRIIGDHATLGLWNVSASVPTTRMKDKNGYWTCTLQFDDSLKGIEYKYLLKQSDGTFVWEDIDENRSIELKPGQYIIDDGEFGNKENVVVQYEELSKPKSSEKKATHATSTKSTKSKKKPTKQAPSPKEQQPNQSILEGVFQLTSKSSKTVSHAAFHPTKPLLVLAVDVETKMYNYENGQVVSASPTFTTTVTCVHFDSNLPLLACGLDNGDVWLFDIEVSKTLCGLKKHTAAVRTMTSHKTLPWLVTGGDDSAIHIWDLIQRKDLFFLSSHRDAVRGVSFAWHCNDLLISASDDRSIRVWDCSSVAERARDSESTPGVAPAIRCVATLSTASVTQAHESGVLFAAMPRSDLLLSTGSDGCLKAWTVAGLTKDTLPDVAPAVGSDQSAESDTVDTAIATVPIRGDGEAPPLDAFVDVLGVETQRAPALPRDATPAELAAFAQCPLTGGGLLRLPTDARTAHDASFAVLFATSRVALLTCADVVPDENDFVPRLTPVCFTIIAGAGAATVATVDAARPRSAEPVRAPAAFAPAQFVATHPSQPLFAIVHGDGTTRVLRVQHQFVLLHQVHMSTAWRPADRLWLARVTRTCTFRKLVAQFATFADPLGISVTTGTGKASFVARLRAQPSRALTFTVGLDAAGRRALQATYDDERDASLWKDVLASFALRVLAHNGWLSFGHRELPRQVPQSGESEAAEAGYCTIQ
mmetsp:Transcript_564/g.781  ORF Transcript_564/g.781 Transcript_564/m.781 type:complete len:717 (-) Transcript_564:50-2200(-)